MQKHCTRISCVGGIALTGRGQAVYPKITASDLFITVSLRSTYGRGNTTDRLRASSQARGLDSIPAQYASSSTTITRYEPSVTDPPVSALKSGCTCGILLEAVS
jgi:hypothetical protein